MMVHLTGSGTRRIIQQGIAGSRLLCRMGARLLILLPFFCWKMVVFCFKKMGVGLLFRV
jgi:hypothetical protein